MTSLHASNQLSLGLCPGPNESRWPRYRFFQLDAIRPFGRHLITDFQTSPAFRLYLVVGWKLTLPSNFSVKRSRVSLSEI